MTPRRRRALEALVARGATPGEREAARQALAKHAAAPKTSESRGRIRGADFTITFYADDAHAVFGDIKITFERDASFDEEFKFRAEPQFRGQSVPKQPGPFGDGSPGPGPRKGEPKAKKAAPRSCGYAFNATFVPSSKSPTGEPCYRSGDVSQALAANLMQTATPVVLLDGEAEFGARCVTWGQHPQTGAVGAYFERITVSGRLEAVLEDTCGMYLVACTTEEATAFERARRGDLYLVTYKGKTWVCRPGGTRTFSGKSGFTFHAVPTRPAP